MVIVDNNSSDDSLNRLRQRYDEPTYLETDSNLGFAGGMNKGIKWARSEGYKFAFLLNNDTIIVENTNIFNLVRKATEDDVGLITPIVYKPNGEPWFIKGIIDYRWVRFIHQEIVIPDKGYIENDYVPLCCALVSIDKLEQIDDLAEEYFVYCEDAELGHQLRKNGYKLLTDVNSEVIHNVGRSSDSSFSPIPAYYRTRNRHIFKDRNINYRYGIFFSLFSIWWIFTRGVFSFYQNGVRSYIALLHGELDGLRGKTGRGPY